MEDRLYKIYSKILMTGHLLFVRQWLSYMYLINCICHSLFITQAGLLSNVQALGVLALFHPDDDASLRLFVVHLQSAWLS